MKSKRKEGYRIVRGYLDFDVFGYRVCFIFTNDLQRARHEYDDIIGHTYDMTGAGACHCAVDATGDNASYLFFKLKATPEQIAHEAYHAIFRLRAWSAVKDDGGEFTAYHLGHLVGNIDAFQKAMKRSKQWRAKNVVKKSL